MRGLWITRRIAFWFRFRGKLIAGAKMYRVGSSEPVTIGEIVYQPDGSVFGEVVAHSVDCLPPNTIGVGNVGWTRYLGRWETDLETDQ